MLDSIAGAASLLIVNDNAPDPTPHARVLARSPFGRENRLVVDRTPFTGFADARNICLDLHRQCSSAGWVAFVDADEVHGPQVARIAGRLGRVPKISILLTDIHGISLPRSNTIRPSNAG